MEEKFQAEVSLAKLPQNSIDSAPKLPENALNSVANPASDETQLEPPKSRTGIAPIADRLHMNCHVLPPHAR